MNRELLVTLLRKDIQELNMITEGFMELTEYPKPIILLAQRKAEDIQNYIAKLADVKSVAEPVEVFASEPVAPIEFVVLPEIGVSDSALESNTEVADVKNEEPEVELLQSEPVIVADPVEETELVEDVVVEEEPAEELTIEIVTESVPESVTSVSEPVKLTTPETIAHSRNELLAKGVDNSLSAVLANKKISDIKQAMSIGDRFRFQRELFNGNGEDMNKTIAYINQLATYQEVESFLKSKYKWADENVTADDFLQIVRRKF